jgi:ribonuclease P protein component
VHSTDFQRLLRTPAWSRSAHFAVHHLPTSPADGRRRAGEAPEPKLSTTPTNNSTLPVDDSPGRIWLGAVLPKRLARRAVTRNLLRRQIRAAMGRHAAALPAGLWVVRLRQPFAASDFVSAASDALRRAARVELDAALAGPGRTAAAPAGGRRGPT